MVLGENTCVQAHVKGLPVFLEVRRSGVVPGDARSIGGGIKVQQRDGVRVQASGRENVQTAGRGQSCEVARTNQSGATAPWSEERVADKPGRGRYETSYRVRGTGRNRPGGRRIQNCAIRHEPS